MSDEHKVGDIVCHEISDPRRGRLLRIMKIWNRYGDYAQLQLVMDSVGGTNSVLGECCGDTLLQDLNPVNPMIVIARVAAGELLWDTFLRKGGDA